MSTYTVNELNQYTQRTVAGAIDVFGLAEQGVTVLVNGAEADQWEGPPLAGPQKSYFHKVVSVDNSTSAQYPTITIQAGNNSVTRHAFVPKNPEVFQYDDDGNLTQDGRWNYEWNGENRLIRMTTRSDVPGPHYQLTFQYDWMGRRVRKTVVNTDTGQTISDLIFLYDGWNLIAEVDAQTGELIRTYVWGLDLSGTMQGAGGIGGLLWINVESGSNAGRYFVAYDGNGNVMGLVSADDGAVAAQYEYGPFAEPLRATGQLAADNPIRFSTKYTDPETGLLYYGYRYYSPSLGRWLSRDPFWDYESYSFLVNNAVDWVDYLELWIIKREGKSRAIAIAEKGDTVEELARQLHLDTKDCRQWLKPINDALPSDAKQILKSCSKFTIPNTVYIDFGPTKIRDPLGVSIFSKWRKMLKSKAQDYIQQGFAVKMSDVKTASDVKRYLKGPDVYIYAGHGSSRSDFAAGVRPEQRAVQAGNIVFAENDTLTPKRYTSYGISLMVILACNSAASEALPEKYKMPFKYSAWEVNVARSGTFIGITDEVDVRNWIYHLLASPGTNAQW